MITKIGIISLQQSNSNVNVTKKMKKLTPILIL
jgi:hypothetical protein